jgi:tetratricopeptide (TPR) repeat protein
MIFTRREDQYWATRTQWEDMAKIIKTKWDEGYAITDMAYGDEVYYVLMEKGTGILGQEYLWNKSFFNVIEEDKETSSNRCITSFFYDKTSFCMVRSSFKQRIDQRWCQSASFPREDIAYFWNMGYSITALNWNRGNWLVLFSKGLDYAQKESWETKFKPKPSRICKSLNQDSRIISSLCYGDGKWAFSYASHPMVFGQKIYMGKEFPEEEISTLWNQNYDISKAAFGNGYWFITFINCYEASFNARAKFKELFRAREYSDASILFKERLYNAFEVPEPIIVDYLQCFIHLKKYAQGIEAFEHFNRLFNPYLDAMYLGGELYQQAYKQNKSEASLRKALKCFSLVSPATPESQKRIKKLRAKLPDNNESKTQWKQRMALKEQERRNAERELKNAKL